MNHSRLPVLVLAGGKTSPEFAAAAGVPAAPGCRALAPLGSATMLQWVVRALRGAERIDRILVVAPAGFPSCSEADGQIAAEGSLSYNILEGLKHCSGAEHALFCTADIPFLTPAAVDDYIARGEVSGCDCAYAVIPREACEREFPGMRRTYLRTPAGQFTGGNLVFQRAATFAQQAAFLDEAHRRRKDPLFLARMMEPISILRFLAGRLQLEQIGAAVTRLTGIRSGLVITPHACVGTDVDRPEDLVLARARLAGRPSG
ncbi:MAG: hypothetical protein FJX77_06565 [Armatimonadetes bacterium]|nr:hypothetical protein [Armatimonadota bacterium]